MTSRKILKNPTGQNDLNAKCLSDKQSAAVEMLVIGKSYQHVADTLGVDRRTIYSWRQDDDFKQALSERRQDRWSAATNRLQSMLDDSLAVIEEQLHDRPMGGRMQCCRSNELPARSRAVRCHPPVLRQCANRRVPLA